jgi:drug/metabolite transporter (DMT)-like permease
VALQSKPHEAHDAIVRPASPPRRTDLDRGYAIAVASAVVLSTTAVLIRHLTVDYRMPALVLAFWRNAFVVLFLGAALALLCPRRLRVGRAHLPYLAGYGAVLAVFNVLWTFSVARCGAAIATVLVYTSCASSALLGLWFLNERMSGAKLAAISLCLAGCALVSGAFGAGWSGSLAGAAAGMLSGICYAAYSVMGRAASQRGLDPWTTVLYTFGSAALVQLAGLAAAGVAGLGAAPQLSDLFWLGGAVRGWAMLCLLSAGPTVIGFGLYNMSLEYLPASAVNLIVTLEPACTAAIAYLLLGERLSGAEIAGSLVILAGVVVLRVGDAVAWRHRAGGPEGRAAIRSSRATRSPGCPSETGRRRRAGA